MFAASKEVSVFTTNTTTIIVLFMDCKMSKLKCHMTATDMVHFLSNQLQWKFVLNCDLTAKKKILCSCSFSNSQIFEEWLMYTILRCICDQFQNSFALNKNLSVHAYYNPSSNTQINNLYFSYRSSPYMLLNGTYDCISYVRFHIWSFYRNLMYHQNGSYSFKNHSVP